MADAPGPVKKTSEAGAQRGLPGAPPAWWRELRQDAPWLTGTIISIASVVACLLGWWLCTRGDATTAWISPSKLPGPGAVFGAFGALVARGLSDGVVASLWRVLLGVALAALVGMTVGVAAASFRALAAALSPLLVFLRSIPMGALVPLTLLLFSTGEKQKVMFIFLAVVPFVLSDTMKAIATVPQRYVETAETLGASRWQIISKVLVPLALPDIVTSLRFQFGLALGYIVLAEAINAEAGLGFLLSGSEKRGLIEHIYLLLFVIAALAFAIDFALRTLQRQLFRYRSDL